MGKKNQFHVKQSAQIFARDWYNKKCTCLTFTVIRIVSHLKDIITSKY